MKIIDKLNQKGIHISFEVFPPKTDAGFDKVLSATDEIAKLNPSYISVTYGAGGGTSKNTAKIASHIKDDLGVMSLAHLTCASSTKEEVGEVIENLKAHGIENILALRGDIPEGMTFPDGDRFLSAYELVQEINAYNGDEKNKEKLIKMVNLTDGGYVSKDKYTNLETDLSGKTTELTKANNLIEELKKSSGKDEETQQKITAYETEIAYLKEENAELKTENALKFALIAAGAVDVDYLVFKAKEKGEIKLGDDGKIKGEDDLISGLKTQHPTMFEASNGNQQQSGNRKILENNLPGGDKDKTVTKEQFLKMGYNERMKLKEENPELFKQLNVH